YPIKATYPLHLASSGRLRTATTTKQMISIYLSKLTAIHECFMPQGHQRTLLNSNGADSYSEPLYLWTSWMESPRIAYKAHRSVSFCFCPASFSSDSSTSESSTSV